MHFLCHLFHSFCQSVLRFTCHLYNLMEQAAAENATAADVVLLLRFCCRSKLCIISAVGPFAFSISVHCENHFKIVSSIPLMNVLRPFDKALN